MARGAPLQWLDEIRIIDGGFGWEAIRRSKLRIEGHKAWSSLLIKEDPRLVVDVHKSFLHAGCDVICTNTYQASPSTLASALSVEIPEARQLMIKAVTLAFDAISQFEKECDKDTLAKRLTPLVAGSLGPYGACLDMEFDELVRFHVQRATILHHAGVHFLAWETIPSLIEVSAIVEAMNRLPDSAIAWVSILTKDGYTTAHGEPLHQVASILRDCEKIFAVGVNCHVRHDCIPIALATLGDLDIPPDPNDDNYHPNPLQVRSVPKCNPPARPRPKLLFAYPSSGEVLVRKRKRVRRKRKMVDFWVWPEDSGPDRWASTVAEYAVSQQMLRQQPGLTAFQISHSRGLAQWIGGCCRVTPGNISDLAMRLKPEVMAHRIQCPTTSVVVGDNIGTTEMQQAPEMKQAMQKRGGKRKNKRKCR
uniref:Hcy-binding domain-containing protein n=1 Tax=Mesocestoides corti TaxID=53468 RepID=A0A5K3FAY9_MESCO